MRLFLRLNTLAALLLITAWTFPGCSTDDAAGGKTQGAMSSGKMEGGGMDKDQMGGAMDKGKMEGGGMNKDKMGGAMDKGKM